MNMSSPQSFREITYEVTDRVATITLNRPEKLNALTKTMDEELFAAMEAADSDDEARVVILTGAGRGFCAGADLSSLDWLAGQDPAAVDRTELRERLFPEHPRTGARPDFQKTYSYFPSVSKPIIAALNGPAVGLGFVLTLYCDVRIASETARFSTAFSQRGLIAEHGISWMLPRLIGIAGALDLLYSSRLIDAHEAHRLGLVNQVVPPDRLADAVRGYATNLATKVSPRSLRIMKRQVYDALFQPLGEAIETANGELLESLMTEDFREGVAHFLEKRDPQFTGR